MDGIVGGLPENAEQLQIVEGFKHLGVNITVNPKLYTTKNLESLIKAFRTKCGMWNRLSLSVIGRCSLIKMTWLP